MSASEEESKIDLLDSKAPRWTAALGAKFDVCDVVVVVLCSAWFDGR